MAGNLRKQTKYFYGQSNTLCLSGCCPLSAFRSLLGISEDIEAPTYASFIPVYGLILAVLAWKGQQPDKHVIRQGLIGSAKGGKNINKIV
jgi:hypothetical protein